MKKHIIVIGGGMAGSAAAHSLVGHGYRVTIVEQNDRLGGRVHSHLVNGAAVETGAGFVTKDYINLWAFLAKTGLAKNLYRQHSSSGVLRNGHIAMATPGALLGNHPLSWAAKLQALPLLVKALSVWPSLDLHAFWKGAELDDRSVADMFNGKAGKEFLEYVLQPVLNGYFYWTPEHTSQAMLLVLCKAAFSHGTYKMQGGLQRIPEAAAYGSTVLLEHTVKSARAVRGTYMVHITHKSRSKTLKADGIVCATTATAVPALFPDLTPQQKRFFAAVRYSSTAVLARTYAASQTLGAKTIAFPRAEGTDLSAVTLSPEPGVDKQKLATIKAFVSGVAAMRFNKLSDKVLGERLAHETELVRSAVLIGNPRPIATQLQRWPEALPYFDVGHFKRLEAFENGEVEDATRPLVFAGDYLGGPFMEGAFTSGLHAAQRLHDWFNTYK